jgi:hypothetical protein
MRGAKGLLRKRFHMIPEILDHASELIDRGGHTLDESTNGVANCFYSFQVVRPRSLSLLKKHYPAFHTTAECFIHLLSSLEDLRPLLRS